MAEYKMEPIPDTVGDFIKILQKFPSDSKLNFSYVEGYWNDAGDSTPANVMNIRHLDALNFLEITIR